ncbi:MAG: PHP domain-containing protein [Candidatus Hodarchaeales archaeon]
MNLHNHSDYSVLDSIVKVEDLVKRAKQNGEKAIALTDHGTVGGLVEFHKVCKKQGIKPIHGCEFYHEYNGDTYHIVALAKNKRGFDNLIRLNNLAVQNFYRKPVVPFEYLKTYSDGIIYLTGCISGYLAKSVLNGSIDMEWYKKMDDQVEIYPEVQLCGMAEQEAVYREYKKRGLRCVHTGDTHYLDKEDKQIHFLLYKLKFKDPKPLNGEYFYRKIDCKVAEEIADSVEEYEIAPDEIIMPKFEFSEEVLIESLRRRCPVGYRQRLEYELKVIKENGFLSYFALVATVCNKFDNRGGFRGWGRGSASGSLVSYLLGITKIDPIEWGLYFERFLNPDRISLPDIDLDFTPEGREKAIDIFNAYGNFQKIGTYQTFGTKDVLITVSKLLGIKTKLIEYVPNEAPIPTLAELVKTKSFLDQVKREHNEEFIRICLKLEGVKKGQSIHASGIVCADGIPLRKYKGKIATAWDMYSLEYMKRVKFDVLSVNNLQMIENLCKQLSISVEDIPLDDEKTFDLIRSGHTLGVFQWESSGYINIIRRLKPETFDELVDLNTLYRPGCLESGITEQYIRRKHGLEPVEQLHPRLKLKHQGLPLFQEDIMTLARVVAGFSAEEADILRKAISKKDKKLLEGLKSKFIASCEDGEKFWNIIEKYGRYTWNLSHAVAYTLISYWTAYFSANYPAYFLCELLNN